MTRLSGSASTAATVLGEQLAPAAGYVIDKVTGLLNAFITADPATKALAAAALGLAAALTGGILVLGGAAAAVGLFKAAMIASSAAASGLADFLITNLARAVLYTGTTFGTAAAGATTATYTYEPYGAVTSSGTDSAGFQYTGREGLCAVSCGT
jgi:hypothetical protein